MTETPSDFNIIRQYDKKYFIKYFNLREIAQGGPEIGNISINDVNLPTKYFFGGPPVQGENYLFAPLFVSKFCKTGFILCKINLETLEVNFIGGIKDLIFLKELDLFNKKIFFYESPNTNKLESIQF